MTYTFSADDQKRLRINNALVHITAREGAIHRINYAIHSPQRTERCANRATNLLSALSLSHPHDPETVAAIDKTLTKLERRPHLLFNRNKNAATQHRIYTCMLMLKQLSLQNLHDAPIGQMLETHLTRALIAHACTRPYHKGDAIYVLDMLLNPDTTPDTKPDFTRPHRHMVSDYEVLKPATERMILAVLNALTHPSDRLSTRLYLQHDANATLRINHPNLQPQIDAWLDAPIMPARPKQTLLQKLKNWAPR